ncbi:unnamed protein product [Polarella glacialis]|uniref:Uncharacterized protein n=1 Tax=Polarella glacialis TaxID=89957 RepID=A0A813D0K4_POLGL|nr:unnamed protein product [Polarella glacialis]CAE8589053.1 unnamed protein product [Polarella glacialis]
MTDIRNVKVGALPPHGLCPPDLRPWHASTAEALVKQGEINQPLFTELVPFTKTSCVNCFSFWDRFTFSTANPSCFLLARNGHQRGVRTGTPTPITRKRSR